MGQKPSKLEVAESCLKPHHPHKCSDVDLRKLRALIKSGKLSPCYLPYEGEDWDARGLEECPICFLSYPALNRSQCCSKEICTECFLQVKLPNGNRGGALCPFCKSEFSVYFKGPRSPEEKEVCRAEERRISQATLRAREAEEARSEERAMKRHMERIEEQEKQAAAAASQPAPSVPERMDSQGDGSGGLARRRSGDVDEEALRAVLLSLDLSEYIPSTIVSSSGLDLDDALLQQAIQASLREQNEQEEVSSPLSPVPPDAVAFSPLAQGTSAFSDSPAASPSRRLDLEGGEAEGSRGQEDAAGARYDNIVDHVFWEEVDLQTRPSTAGISEQPLSQEDPSSSGSESPRPEAGPSSSPDDSRGRMAESQPCAGPSSSSTTGLGGERQSGCAQAQAPQQDTAGGADLFNSQEIAGNLTGPSQAVKAPQRGSSGFNLLSTMSSTTMESLLLTVRDFEGGLDTSHSLFQDILATPPTPIMLSGGALPGLGSPVSQQILDALPAELSSACVAALLRPAAQAALSREKDSASAAASPSKPGTGCPPPKEAPAEGLAAEGRREPSRGNAKEGGQGSSRAAGARGAAFKVKVNRSTAAAPSSADRGQLILHMSSAAPETEKAEVPLVVAQGLAGTVAAGSLARREGHAALGDGSGHRMAELPVEAGSSGAAEAAPNTWEGSSTGVAEAAWEAERASSTQGPQRQPAGEAAATSSSRTSSAVSLEAILEHAGQSGQGPPQGLPAASSCAPGEPPMQSAALPSTPGAAADTRGPALHPPLFGVSLDAVSEGMIRRLSSGASSNGGELIAALHSPEPAAQPPIDSPRSPLPAPPQHLKTFLSGGKRYASPLSARSSPGAPAQEPAGATQHPAAAAVQQKGLSFADLVGVKGRRSSLSGKKPGRPGAQKSHCFGAPATLTVGMVLTSPVNGGKPATAEKPAPDAAMDKLQAGEMPEGVAVAESAVREAPCIQPAGAVPASADSLPELQEHGGVKAGAVEVSQSRSESVQEGNGHSGADDAREGPSSSSELEAGPCQDQPGTSLEQGAIIYEEPSSSGRMHLDKDGGAVLLTNPDGSTQLVLLTSDQQQQVAAAQSWKLPPPETPTYTAPSTPEDLRMQQRIARADEIMRRLYESLQQSSASTAEAQSSRAGVQDDFAERLRTADEAFQSALNARATKTGIDAADGKDTSDDKLQRLIAERDASVFKSS